MPVKKSGSATIAVLAREAPHLSRDEHALLAEALRLGEETRRAVQDAIVDFGRWILVHVFADDARAALEDRSDNAVWLELRRRAGGPSLAMSDRMLYVALHLAARDKRIADQAWRGLDAGRKELLLPLGEDDAIREAAHHVARFNLSQPNTRAYVRSLLTKTGRAPALRLTAPRFIARLRGIRGKLEQRGLLKKLEEIGDELDATTRKKALAEIDGVKAALLRAERALKKGR